ncbi:MAG: DNA polymerase III subunit delta [Methylococcaceae bacterium]|nr:DNA polymerase III subunit delta [Methylococcaceae bacterium]
MRLKPEQLSASLQKRLVPVYLITGDEPLQMGELADAIRKTARQQGYESREVISVDNGFAWGQLSFSANSLSLFAEKKIIDLRIPSGAPGVDGSKALIAYCERLPEDNLLLITAGKIASSAFKSRWLETVDKTGIIVQVWPLESHDLLRWLQQRMQQRGLSTEPEGIKILASKIEGNLLAAAQEIEKLYVLYGEGKLSAQQILDVVADSSRYDVFKLVDALLAQDIDRIVKILFGLQAEGMAAPVVLWALTREARMLIKIRQALSQGQSKDVVFKSNQIWDKRRPLVDNALIRLTENVLNKILTLGAKADRQIKGQQQGDAWESMLEICLKFASVEIGN